MKKINKDNLIEFVNYYHGFHDSYICRINYDINTDVIELFIDVCWSGEPILKNDRYYDTNKTKLKMIFNKIYKINIREIFFNEYIDNICFKYIVIDGKESICFANDNTYPSLYIVCDCVEYEIIN